MPRRVPVRLTLLLGAAALAMAGHAHAKPTFSPTIRDKGSCYVLTTYNQTPKWAWITVYDLAKIRHLDYGWVAPFSKREWRSGRYACGSYYYVRGELKNTEGGSPPAGDPGNIFDTTVQAHFLSFSPGSATGSVVYLKTQVLTAYVDSPPNTWSYDNHKFWWDVDDDKPHANTLLYMYVRPTYVNGTTLATQFTITSRAQPGNVLPTICVDGNARSSGSEVRPGTYHVKATTFNSLKCSPSGVPLGAVTRTVEGDVTIGDQSGYLDVTSSTAASLSFTFNDMP